jgi:serine/threonine-protein kinase
MASPSEIPPDALLGGKLRLIHRIGRGGMGDVWIARNEATQAEVAVKTLQRSERTPTHDERFRREARLAATISHRNVVRIFDLVDDADGTLGLVMELLRGGTLEACIRERGPITTLHAIAVAVPILSALHHVHQKGIVHRDVKPANMFFAVEPDGHVIPKILDFGIAKLPAASSPLTVDGSVLGTPHYMAPEQIRGQEDLDGRSDMFSMAVVLYEMLTGVRVFQRDSAAASLAAVLEHEVDPDPRIEPRVWVAISRALAKRPYERFANCAEFAEALRKAVDATDEDYALALQELRPRSDAIPEGEFPKTGGISQSSSRTRKKPGRSSSLMRTVGMGGAVAVLAIVGTLIVTRPGSSSGAPGRAEATSTSATLPIVPPPSSAVASAATADTAVPVTSSSATDLGDIAPSPTPLVGGKGTSASTAGTTSTGRVPGGRPVRPATSNKVVPTKPVATSPGF